MKLKTKPSAKIHRRFLLLNINSKKEVERVILDYLGILGFAKASPLFITNKIKGKLILAVDRKSISDIRAAFELSKTIKTLRVSGTLKGLTKRK